MNFVEIWQTSRGGTLSVFGVLRMNFYTGEKSRTGLLDDGAKVGLPHSPSANLWNVQTEVKIGSGSSTLVRIVWNFGSRRSRMERAISVGGSGVPTSFWLLLARNAQTKKTYEILGVPKPNMNHARFRTLLTDEWFD